MSTKDCIVALNTVLDGYIVPYEGNRKFKRLSKKMDESGQVVRVFADNLHTFKVVGDGPYKTIYDIDDVAAYNPPDSATAAATDSAAATTSTMGAGWYFGLAGSGSSMVDDDFQEGVECGFFLVRKSYYDAEGFLESIHVSGEFPGLPSQFDEVMEAAFLSYWDVDTTRAWLLANGFETNAKLEAMANDADEE